MNIVLGVGGGIAAYKSALLLRLFTEAGHSVTVIPTQASTKFVGVATWEALSGRPVTNDVFDAVDQVNHVRIGHEADLIVVAPATADLLARAAGGHADDLLTTTLLMARGPVLFAPAMHTEMWQHASTQANVATLRSRGVNVLDPAVGRLTGPDTGPGRLPEPEAIFAAAMALLGSPAPEALDTAQTCEKATEQPESPAVKQGSLSGVRVLITAGGTREPLDPVRFLGNKSSGKQGVALAEAALAAGADVTFVHAHMEVAAPAGAKLQRVETALELRAATLAAAASADVVIMAAAVADFRPSNVSQGKIKKRDDTADPIINLIRNPDILLEVVAHRAAANRRQLIVGFAAETGDEQGDARSYAEAKLQRKGCDLLVLNEVGPGESGSERVFGQDSNKVQILSLDGANPVQASGSKRTVANAVVALIAERLGTT
ncbi:phosphopantothenate--cysteine ligase family flavoprotein [Arthrobacter sp. GMC3]|uniref:bifunctional phosphopantothenoylcysteine decarboxylase/phosphopantothenate synthase n=1 Tax=Arthrobacter sp. GMC3 TaxID=2058894 RepID=UPI000CE3864F|nr:bifunctional phosphopantothenoylcysteine decarboxylase/phosphopantothenate synthase [Arthrobacter sp. GMC3]